jgi:hypothetical protein
MSCLGEDAMRIKSLTVFVAVLLVAAAVPAASAATTSDVTVEQDGATGDVLVAVTDNGTAVENATVTVDGDAGYADERTYRTDANGTVSLAQPEDTQNVTVVATDGNRTAETTVLIEGDEDLSVDVTQASDGSVTVGVERNGSAVPNATVEVSVANDSYAAVGNYTTDENGTVGLAAPDENVTATVTVAEGDDETTRTVTLVAPEADLGLDVEQRTGVEVSVERGDEAVENATVNVTSDGDYDGTGTYETDADGTVSLPAPTENVSVTVTATADGDTVSETVGLTTEFVEAEENFGSAVKRFVDALRAAGFDGPPGRIISDFVTENNPGNADDAPGQSGDAPGQSGDAPGQAKQNADADDEAAQSEDGEQGPPEHAKEKKNEKRAQKDADDDSAETEEDDAEEAESEDDSDDESGDDSDDDADSDDADESDDSDDDGQGPPDHAKGNGNGKN